MAKIPAPPITKLALSAFVSAIAFTIIDSEGTDQEFHQRFWANLQLHITHMCDAIPETHAEHRPVIEALVSYLQALYDNHIDHLAGMSESESQAGFLRRAVLVDILEILDQEPPPPPPGS